VLNILIFGTDVSFSKVMNETAVVSYKSPNAKNCWGNMGRFVYNTHVFHNPYRDPQPAMQNQISFLKMITDDRSHLS